MLTIKVNKYSILLILQKNNFHTINKTLLGKKIIYISTT